ncbi:MAG: ATP-binding protein [Caldilineaceae bacterium]
MREQDARVSPADPQRVGWFDSLRWRLTAVLGIILGGALVAMGISGAIFVQQIETDNWHGRQSEAARNAVHAVEAVLENTRYSLRLISAMGLDELTEEPQTVAVVLAQHPLLEGLVYVNTLGQVIAAASIEQSVLNNETTVGSAPWFLAAQAGQEYYGPLMLSLHQRPYIIIALPLSNASVMAAQVNMNALWTLVAETHLGESGRVYVVDRQGNIIAHTDESVVLEHKSIELRSEWQSSLRADELWYGEYTNFQDEKVVGVVGVIPGAGWRVFAEMPRSEAFAISRKAFWVLGGVIVTLIVLLMWASSEWLEGTILTPVDRLRDGAVRIGQGDLSYRMAPLHADEIGQVTLSFNQMAAELQWLYDSLEQKIKERTAQLAQQTAELARSNAELAQFAYIASHDLQEPLRMVTSYLQLIERRYRGKLDQDADEFIAFAVEGATRMQQLIRDLLAYSRVGAVSHPLPPVNSHFILKKVLENLQVRIQETSAAITHDPLPTVAADATQLSQLFQNLIANAIKFCKDRQPQIHVSASLCTEQQEWIFCVEDNGIGIAPEYFGRIFLIFQRLHTRSEYAGTGIGLAICKKIVESHGGRIWLDSALGIGTRFYFTLPATVQTTP